MTLRMDPAERSIEFAQERVDTFERINSLLKDSDGPRAIEAAQTYIRLWNSFLADAVSRESELTSADGRDPL